MGTLSLASTTTSYCRTSSRAFAGKKPSVWGTTYHTRYASSSSSSWTASYWLCGALKFLLDPSLVLLS